MKIEANWPAEEEGKGSTPAGRRCSYLAATIRLDPSADSARGELVRLSGGLVEMWIRPFLRPGWEWAHSRDDLHNTAVIGLLEAASKYDPSRGAFHTIARFYVLKAVKLWCLGFRHRFGFPRRVSDVSGWPEIPFVALVEDVEEAREVDGFESEEMARLAVGLVDRMAEPMRSAIRARFGLDGRGPRAQEDIAEELGIHKRRVSMLVENGLASIRARLDRVPHDAALGEVRSIARRNPTVVQRGFGFGGRDAARSA